MNIFYLHWNGHIAAGMHCDKHVGKMLIESCQLLATAHHHYGNGDKVTYKATHKNHPSAIWVRESRLHYDYLVQLARGLAHEFWARYGKHHKSHGVLVDQLLVAPPVMFNMPLTWRPPTLAMPDDFKCDDHIESYRRYYASKAAYMPMVYSRGRRPQPTWLSDLLDFYKEAA